mgnify:CR=1 FL=1
MKKIYILSALLFICTSFSAQDLFTCYDEWAKVFENRGAFFVNDGEHDKVVLVVRKGKSTNCYTASVGVKGGVVISTALYFDDDSYEAVEYEFKDDLAWSINNGMSADRTTLDDEVITILFTDKIQPKKKTGEDIVGMRLISIVLISMNSLLNYISTTKIALDC